MKKRKKELLEQLEITQQIDIDLNKSNDENYYTSYSLNNDIIKKENKIKSIEKKLCEHGLSFDLHNEIDSKSK